MNWMFWRRSKRDQCDSREALSVLDVAEIEREQEIAHQNAKEKGKETDKLKRELRQHRKENHFSELVAHVLRGEE